MASSRVERVQQIYAFLERYTIVVPDIIEDTKYHCVICQEDYNEETAVRVIVPDCGHVFGHKCLHAIMSTDIHKEKTCPLCRCKWMPAMARGTSPVRAAEAREAEDFHLVLRDAQAHEMQQRLLELDIAAVRNNGIRYPIITLDADGNVTGPHQRVVGNPLVSGITVINVNSAQSGTGNPANAAPQLQGLGHGQPRQESLDGPQPRGRPLSRSARVGRSRANAINQDDAHDIHPSLIGGPVGGSPPLAFGSAQAAGSNAHARLEGYITLRAAELQEAESSLNLLRNAVHRLDAAIRENVSTLRSQDAARIHQRIVSTQQTLEAILEMDLGRSTAMIHSLDQLRTEIRGGDNEINNNNA